MSIIIMLQQSSLRTVFYFLEKKYDDLSLLLNVHQ